MGVLSKRSIHNFRTIRCPQFFAFFFWFFFQLWRMRYLLSSVSKSVWCSSHSILVIDLKKCGIGWWSGWAAGLLICFFTSDEKECSETRSTVLTVLLVRLVFSPYSPVVWWTRGGGELDSKELWGGGCFPLLVNCLQIWSGFQHLEMSRVCTGNKGVLGNTR